VYSRDKIVVDGFGATIWDQMKPVREERAVLLHVVESWDMATQHLVAIQRNLHVTHLLNSAHFVR